MPEGEVGALAAELAAPAPEPGARTSHPSVPVPGPVPGLLVPDPVDAAGEVLHHPVPDIPHLGAVRRHLVTEIVHLPL